ncbi:hypothetical protein ERO13_A13G032300v2 [Gossypium hirsutum]|nr:hypothetical protein ERO13_A13G032300v2 [Gossypium hirsutum]
MQPSNHHRTVTDGAPITTDFPTMPTEVWRTWLGCGTCLGSERWWRKWAVEWRTTWAVPKALRGLGFSLLAYFLICCGLNFGPV